MIIYALDLSLKKTGCCHPDGSTHLITTTTLSGPHRLAYLRDAILRCVTTAPMLDLAVIEGQSYGHNTQGHADLAGLHAVVKVALWERGIPYVDVPPSSLKMVACGSGNASKDDVHEAAIRRLGYRGGNKDQADALWLWTAARVHYGCAGVPELPATHRRGLGKIPWPDLEPHLAHR
jgi:crossover junction endodeoxyribonuclease RuvC